MSDLLEKLKPRVETVRVYIQATGREEDINIVPLTYFEWMRVEMEVPYPAMPKTKGMNPRPDPTDPKFVAQCNEVDEERNLRRLALALSKAGHNMAAYGATVELQTQALRQIDAGVVSALVNFLRQAAGGGQARVEDRAETFRRNGAEPAEGVRETQDNPE